MTLIRRVMLALPSLTWTVRAPLPARRRIGTLNVPFLLTRTVLRAMTFLPRLMSTVTLPVLALDLPVTAKRDSLPARSVAGALAISAGVSAASAGALVLGAVADFVVAELVVVELLVVELSAAGAELAGASAGAPASAGAAGAGWLTRAPPGMVADSLFEWTLSPSPDSPSLDWSSK